MKQHITIEQLNKLSEKGKNNFNSWRHNSDHELPNIGQMIEFLEDKKLRVPYNNDEEVEFFGVSKDGQGHWYVGVDGSDELAATDHIRLELCDALFEAVREVLEK